MILKIEILHNFRSFFFQVMDMHYNKQTIFQLNNIRIVSQYCKIYQHTNFIIMILFGIGLNFKFSNFLKFHYLVSSSQWNMIVKQLFNASESWLGKTSQSFLVCWRTLTSNLEIVIHLFMSNFLYFLVTDP